MAPDANAPCPVPAIAPISANLASCERIGTPGRACVSDPLPLRGRPPLQGGHYILPLAKGESRRRRQGVAHTRPHDSTLRSEVLKLARMGLRRLLRFPSGQP